ncbi:MAG: hypothetical protein WEC33_02945 [Dehalococcoidia bacterium]
MKTSIYEADPFGGSKGEHYVTLDSDYRFEKGDEIWLEPKDGQRVKVRITWVNLTVCGDGSIERELLGLKL